MEKLSVIGVEDDVLVVESDNGTRFAIDVAALPEPRRQRPAAATHERKATPREIQAAMRAGQSAEDVASSTGEELEYVRRFEGPVIAERDHILDLALSVAVASGDLDPLAGETTFGKALTARLAELDVTEERWTAWKEPTDGWTVRLQFHAGGADHDARWSFQPRKATLSPANKEATALSQQGDATSVLVPRLRALDRPEPPVAAEEARERPAGPRFDSGAFRAINEAPSKPVTPTKIHGGESSATQPAEVQKAAISTAKPATAHNHTTDLLDALRKRRTEREAALAHAEAAAPEPAPEPQNDSPLFDVSDDRPGHHTTSPLTNARPKRGARAAMPSWDEIVFGSRGDDEPA